MVCMRLHTVPSSRSLSVPSSRTCRSTISLRVQAIASPPRPAEARPAEAERELRVSSQDEASTSGSYDGLQASVALQGPWDQQRDVLTQLTTPLRRGWNAYQRSLEESPTVTKGFTSFVGFALGDALAQKIEGGEYDPFRALRLSLYGLLVDGPVGHIWYKLLDKTVCPDAPQSNKAVLLKTAADQLVWAPVMTCVFFAVLKSLEGHPELIWPTVQDKLVKTVVANYVIWPAAHYINFKFVPSEHRILYNNCVSVAWNAYLSTLCHQPSIDLDGLLDTLDTADNLLDAYVPKPVQGHAIDAMKRAVEGLQGSGDGRFPINPLRAIAPYLRIDP